MGLVGTDPQPLYTEGADSMPRTKIDGVPTYAGVAGSSLIVGFGK